MPAYQVATFRPNVIGVAGCSSVRPVITVPACSSDIARSVCASRVCVPSMIGTARLSSMTSAVSEMSWLVTPQCTNGALHRRRPTRRAARSAATSGTIGVADARASRASDAASK